MLYDNMLCSFFYTDTLRQERGEPREREGLEKRLRRKRRGRSIRRDGGLLCAETGGEEASVRCNVFVCEGCFGANSL